MSLSASSHRSKSSFSMLFTFKQQVQRKLTVEISRKLEMIVCSKRRKKNHLSNWQKEKKKMSKTKIYCFTGSYHFPETLKQIYEYVSSYPNINALFIHTASNSKRTSVAFFLIFFQFSTENFWNDERYWLHIIVGHLIVWI